MRRKRLLGKLIQPTSPGVFLDLSVPAIRLQFCEPHGKGLHLIVIKGFDGFFDMLKFGHGKSLAQLRR